MASSLSYGSSSFSSLGSTRGGSAGILLYHSMPALLPLGNSTTSGGLGVECIQPSLDISGKLCVSFSCISSSSSVQVSGRTCQRSTQMFDSGGTMLNGGSLASHNSQHVGRHSSALSHHKTSCHGCLGRPCAQGSAISAFNPLAAPKVCVVQIGVLFLILSGSGRDNLSVYIKGLQAVLEGRASWCAQEGVPNNVISVPNLANFLLHLFRVGLAWCTIGIYHSAISAFLEPHNLHKASNHPVISKLMHHFLFTVSFS